MLLERLLRADRVRVHPDVIKEFALGRKSDRLEEYVERLRIMPRIDELSISEFLAVVDEFSLRGSGKSRDTFLFAAAIQHGVLVLTGDRAFQRKCERVGLCFLCEERLPTTSPRRPPRAGGNPIPIASSFPRRRESRPPCIVIPA